jgi:Domain of unknown function (DUF4411)
MAGELFYSVDTSALIDWWVRYYPPTAFKGLIPRVEVLIADGRLRASREVQEEIHYENEGLRDWLKAQADLCVESDEAIQKVVADLMDRYHNHDKPDKGINGADPFVIGLAATQKPAPWVVVHGEKPGSSENPKIPWVCNNFQPAPIRHMSFLEMIVAEAWQRQAGCRSDRRHSAAHRCPHGYSRLGADLRALDRID